MKIKQKAVTTMRMSAEAKSHARTDISVRDLESIVDEPPERHGTNKGLTPTETLMSSLMGCTNVITSRIAEGMGVKIEDMTIDLKALFDRTGASLQDEIAVPFPEINMTIALKTDATAEQMEKIKSDLAKFCPIAKVIRAAGTPINETWQVSSL
ncbi:MAG: OsmC family protein [Pseudomonadota bacterium]